MVQPEPARGEVRERIRHRDLARLPHRLAELDVTPEIRVGDRQRESVEGEAHHDGDDGELLPWSSTGPALVRARDDLDPSRWVRYLAQRRRVTWPAHRELRRRSPRAGSRVTVKRERNVLPRMPSMDGPTGCTTATTSWASTSPTRSDGILTTCPLVSPEIVCKGTGSARRSGRMSSAPASPGEITQ